MLLEKSVWVLNARTLDAENVQVEVPSGTSSVPVYYTATDGATITVVAVPNAFAFIDVNNDVSSLSFNVTADVSELSLGDKVLICFRYSSLNASNLVTVTILSPIIFNPPESFTVKNFDDGSQMTPRYLLDLTFNGTKLVWTYEIC
jgi:hypothetical protein